jgi:hypothetical protein
MIDESYIETLQERIAHLIELTKNTYERLTTSTNLTPYEYKQQEDELTELIIRIMFYRKQIFRLVNSEETLEEIPTREDYAKIRHQRLLNDKAMFEEQISIIDKAIADIGDNKKLDRLINQLEMEKFRNQTPLGAIISNLRIYEQKPDLSDGEIDIYLNSNEGDISFRGIIYLHDTSLEVGVIDYRGPCDSKWLGDIGYTINEEYRGNNYAYKALELISPVIASKGIDKVTITTYANNIPSVKTIEKFGGVLTDTINQDVLSYTCEIKPILTQPGNKQSHH